MSKFKKVLFVILAIIFVAIVVLYAIFPTRVKQVGENVWAFLNAPLPIVGVSLLIIGGFIWKFLRGKAKIKELEERYKAKLDELNSKKDDLSDIEEKVDQELANMKNTVVEVCLTIPNVKVNKIGEELKDGKERTNNN